MKLLRKFAALFRKEKLDAEMSGEMQAHLELQTRQNIARGMAPDDARYAAQRSFGGVEQIKERVREQRGLVWLEQLAQDVRYAARSLRKNLGFAFLAVAMLAVGIGTSAMVFGAVKGVLLRPLPYPQADRLAWIFSSNASQDVGRERVSAADLNDLRAQSASLETLAGIGGWNLVFAAGEGRESWQGLMVTPELFDVLRVEPVAGRRLSGSGAGDEIMISHELWQRRFGGRPDVVGAPVRFGESASRTVVGVLPPGLEFPLARSPQAGNGSPLTAGRQDFWIVPRRESGEADRGARFLTAVGRLRPEASVARTNTELQHLGQRFAREHPTTNAGWSFFAEPMRDQILGRTGPALKILLGAVGLLVLLVCANVANLLLCRGLVRESELALRAALGASRGRILRQLLAESVLLAGLGGIAGVLLAIAGVRALQIVGPATLPFLPEVRVDGLVLVAAMGLTLLSGWLAGLAPAWRFSQPNPQEALRRGGPNVTAAVGTVRLKNTLVTAQIAATVVLLSAAMLLLQSFVRLTSVDLGYRPRTALVAELGLPDAAGQDFRARLFERLQGLPWVKAAGAVHSVPLTGTWVIRDRFKIQGRAEPREGGWEASLSFVGFDYFGAMGVPLLRGRNFEPHESLDLENAPVAIVSESFARKFFPGEDALGKIILAPGVRERRIVGIVADTRDRRLEAAPEPQFYLPLVLGDMKLVVATAGAPEDYAAVLRAEIVALDARVIIGRLTPMSAIVAELLEERRFVLILLAGFAAVALLLGSAGVYGVLSHGVVQRRKEIGVRLALGAPPSAIRAMTLRQGASLVWRGTWVGTALALAVMRLLESQLFEVKVLDGWSYAQALAALFVATMLACWLPARRAAKVDPMVALRAE